MKMKTSAESTAGAAFAVALVLCASALMIMGTVKIGLVWFT